MKEKIKHGYKKTEIGVIPEDWEVKELGEIGEVIIGLTYSPMNVSEYGTLVLRSSNIANNKLSFENNVFVQMNLPPRVIVKEGDLLICVRNGSKNLIGKCALIDAKTAGVAFGAFMSIFRSDINKYILYVFQSLIILKQIEENLGATINQITNKSLKSFQIPLPPLPEQEKIAEALSDCDAWIESTEQLLAKKKLLKQGAMQQLLSPKEDWEVKTVFEIVYKKKNLFNDGDWIEAVHLKENGVRLLQTGNIGIGSFIERENKKYISEESFSQLNCKEVFENDILICRLAEPAGRCCLLPKLLDNKAIVSVDISIYRPDKDNFDRKFLVYMMCKKEWFAKVTESVGGTTHKRISRSNLGNIEVEFPSLTEQRRISGILSDMDSEIESLEATLHKARQIKQGMMQDLLTGKVRLLGRDYQ